jgi:hypothetical protein
MRWLYWTATPRRSKGGLEYDLETVSHKDGRAFDRHLSGSRLPGRPV